MIVASRFHTSLMLAATLVLGAWHDHMRAAQPAQSAGEAELLALLMKAALYVKEYESQFARVVGTELYIQDVKDERRTPRRRIDSEVSFARLGEGTPWLMVRNVLMVNGRRVAEASQGAIERAFSAEGLDRMERLKALRDGGARYNAGEVSRNFNDPMLAFMFLDDVYRDRFRFEPDGAATIGGQPTTRVRFEEIALPTMISGVDGENLPASGRLFIDAGGRIMKTEMTVGSGKYSSTIVVTFKHDPGIGMLVPATMDERHLAIIKDPNPQVDDRQSIIMCHAEYSKFRKFDTAGRLVTPPPR